jgi:hypothetical protein
MANGTNEKHAARVLANRVLGRLVDLLFDPGFWEFIERIIRHRWH